MQNNKILVTKCWQVLEQADGAITLVKTQNRVDLKKKWKNSLQQLTNKLPIRKPSKNIQKYKNRIRD